MTISTIVPSIRAFAIGLLFSFLISCDSDPEPNRITPVLLQTIPIQPEILMGSGHVIAIITDNGVLKMYQQNPVDPDLLQELSTYGLNYEFISTASLNSQWATCVIPSSNFSSNRVVLMDVSDPVHPALVADLESGGLPEIISFLNPIEHAVAYNNFLLLVISELDPSTFVPKPRALLVNITVPTAPVLMRNYELSEFPTDVFALESGFFMITTGGYAYVNAPDLINISLTEGANEDLANTAGVLDGDKLFLAGRTSNFLARLGQLNLANPGTPTLAVMTHNIECEGDEFQFTYDGVNNDYYLQDTDSIKVYNEALGVFTLHKAAQYKRYGPLYAWNGRFYSYEYGGGDLKVYKMPDE